MYWAMIMRGMGVLPFLACFLVMVAVTGYAQSDSVAVVGTYQGRVSDDSIYAFDVNGARRTYRCSFCPFYFGSLKSGAMLTIYARGSVVTAIESPGGQIWSERSVRPRKWLRAMVVIFVVVLPMMVFNHFTKRKKRTITGSDSVSG